MKASVVAKPTVQLRSASSARVVLVGEQVARRAYRGPSLGSLGAGAGRGTDDRDPAMRRARPRQIDDRGPTRRSARTPSCGGRRRGRARAGSASARRACVTGSTGLRPATIRGRCEVVPSSPASRGEVASTAEIESGSTRNGARSPDRLGEALAVGGDEPRGGVDDGARATVVRGEHDAVGVRVRAGEAQDPAHIGEPPGVDRLVVVADDEEVVLRRGQEADEPELRRVDVLELVDAHVGEARCQRTRTAASDSSRSPARTTRSSKSIAPRAVSRSA